MKKSKKGMAALMALAAAFLMFAQKSEACTRAVYLGPDNMVITGRTMDWKEDIMSNLYLFPRGVKRVSYDKGEVVNWTSKYGSIVASAYDLGICDGMNEKGLVASLLFLPESIYTRPNDARPVMGIGIWTQYVLDNFATVSEAVAELKKETFRIDAPHLPNGAASTLHMAITDETGNTAVLEYIDGNLIIHEGKQYQVMTNSPRYDLQLAVNDYWKEVGGLQMLPGTNRSSEDRVYYFESTLTPNLFWIDLKKVDFSPKVGVKKLTLTNGEIYAGEANKDFKESKGFNFLFRLP